MLLEFVCRFQAGITECAGPDAVKGTRTDGVSYVQIPGATISSIAPLDTFCGDFLSSISMGETSQAVIGKLIWLGYKVLTISTQK